MIGNGAETLLDLANSRRRLRVEWYIVILIQLELAPSLYDTIGHA